MSKKIFHSFTPNHFNDGKSIMSAYCNRGSDEKFRYIRNPALDVDHYPEKNVFSVTFKISRGGHHFQKITFEEPVTILEAILAAEEFLSYPVEKSYFDCIKNDTWSIDKHKKMSEVQTDEHENWKLQNRGMLLAESLTLQPDSLIVDGIGNFNIVVDV